MHDESVQMEAMVTAGLELTVHRIAASATARPTSGRFTFHAGDTRAAVDYRSEAGRIDLNAGVQVKMLAGLFTTLGARPAAAEFYAERIVGWRTSVNPQGQDTETSTYRTAGVLYGPRLGPFPHTGELSLCARLAGIFCRARFAVCDGL